MEAIQKKIYSKLERMSTRSGVITLFLLAHAVLLSMMMFTFPRINDKFGTQAFDLKTFGYSVSEANDMLQNLDPTTVNLYIFPQLFFLDILYPILLALFLTSVIIRLSNLIKMSTNGIFSKLYLLPFIAMVFDYLENGAILLMITNPTNVSLVIIKVASMFTQLKGILTMLSWTIILVLLGVWVINKLQGSKSPARANL